MMEKEKSNIMIVGVSQLTPVWLDKEKTIERVIIQMKKASERGCRLLAFSEGLVPGYPFWVSFTDGARFDSTVQKEIFAHYVDQSVNIEQGDLESICAAASENAISIYLGIIERAEDRGNHSLYCSLVYIDSSGVIQSVHRKLVPTYEERLVWSNGDGHGLKVHSIEKFRAGGLNCWENWMPMARQAIYSQGANIHVAVWPGSLYNTEDITRFIARESRSYVVSASSVLRKQDIPESIPHFDLITPNSPDILANGGSCIAGPDGEWLIEPVIDEEALIVATFELDKVRQERQNFDPSGHYSRPDVFQLDVDRKRQIITKFHD
jgi:nitrilase